MTSRSPVVRYATGADLDAYYGQGNRPSPSMRAIVAELDGEILGVAGLIYWRDQRTAISDMRPAMQDYPVTVMKAARMFARLLNQYGDGALAIASDKYPRAAEFLTRVGFKHIGRIKNGEVFQWQIQ